VNVRNWSGKHSANFTFMNFIFFQTSFTSKCRPKISKILQKVIFPNYIVIFTRNKEKR